MSTMEGKTVNGYTLKSPLGKGGMAEVWLAENELGMQAAVKILSDELSRNEQMQERFLNEAKVMVKLDHPNIRKVYGYGKIDGRPCIIMEYLDGNDLKARLKRGQRFTDQELQKWWNQLVDALNYTHAQNIVHRDIKPSNIFIDRKGDVKLLDFGIAKVTDTTTGTQTGSTLGTRIYMSPEQVKDPKRVGTKSDVYSLAVSFVHLLTGKAPYDSTTSSDYDIQVSIVTKPIDLSPLPQAWQGFLAPYLEKDPEKRPDLRPFEVVPLPAAVDESTLADDSPSMTPTPVNNPSAKTPHSGLDPLSPALIDKSTSKKSLWIALAAVTVVVALLALFLKPNQEPVPVDFDTQAYEACQTVADYRTYMHDYGCNALHYADAKAFVEQYVIDSVAQQQAEAEQKAQTEAEKKEDAAFKECTTVASCETYLKTYPKGKYVKEVKNKKAELEEQVRQETEAKTKAEAEKAEEAAYKKCTTIAACNAYLNKYPNGMHRKEVLNKKENLRASLKSVLPSNSRPDLVYFFSKDSNVLNNNSNTRAEDAMLKELIESYNIKGFRIAGWSSPEYGIEGLDISAGYARAVEKHIKDILTKTGMNVDDYEYKVEGYGGDLQYFIEKIESSGIDDKQQIIRTIMISGEKERTLKELFIEYPELENRICPIIRRAEVYVY